MPLNAKLNPSAFSNTNFLSARNSTVSNHVARKSMPKYINLEALNGSRSTMRRTNDTDEKVTLNSRQHFSQANENSSTAHDPRKASPKPRSSAPLIRYRCPKLKFSHITNNLQTTKMDLSEDESVHSSDSSSGSEIKSSSTKRFYEKYPSSHEYFSEYNTIVDRDLIIERENAHLSTHIPLYTAFKKEVFLLQVFYSALLTASNPERRDVIAKRIWFRDAFRQAPGVRYQTIQDFLKFKRCNSWQQDVALDNKRSDGWHLISCNPHLYGNTLICSEESTLDYFFNNTNVTVPSIKDNFNALLKQCELNKIEQHEIETLYQRLESCLKILTDEHGIMQQIFIPRDEVNNLVYISKANGIPDTAHTNPLKALKRLQRRNADSDDQTMQVRLLVPRFLDPNFDADYIAYTYSASPQEAVDEFRRAVKQVVCDLIDANVKQANKTAKEERRSRVSDHGRSGRVPIKLLMNGRSRVI